MARIAVSALIVMTIVCLNLFASTSADDDHKHKKVIIHVPYKIHTIHHHSVKKVPVYHYYDHHDHHHHHHHHEDHHEEEHHGGDDWD